MSVLVAEITFGLAEFDGVSLYNVSACAVVYKYRPVLVKE